MSLTTMLKPTETAPSALSTPRSLIEMELAHSECQKFSAKRHPEVIKILYFCIIYRLHEQKKSVALIFLDFQHKAGMHPDKIAKPRPATSEISLMRALAR